MLLSQSPAISLNDAPPYTNNWEALKAIKDEKDWMSFLSLLVGASGIIGSVYLSPLGLLGLGPFALTLKRIEKIARVVIVMTTILEEFESQGVEVFPLLSVPDCQPIDLLIRFPQKAFLIISIRSMGNSKIVFNESNESLCIRRKGKGLKKWQPDPLVELSSYQSWLYKNRQQFGWSSKEVRKPLSKVLLLWGETKIDNHREHLYATMNEGRFLALSRKGTAFVILEEQIIDFINAYLTKYEAQVA